MYTGKRVKASVSTFVIFSNEYQYNSYCFDKWRKGRLNIFVNVLTTSIYYVALNINRGEGIEAEKASGGIAATSYGTCIVSVKVWQSSK